MRERDAEVVIAAGCLLHDTGMSIHRTDHEAYSLFLAADRLPELLPGIYDEPERSVVCRRRCTPSSVTAAAATRSRSRRAWCAWPTRWTSRRAARGCRSRGRPNIHSLSAAAIDE